MTDPERKRKIIGELFVRVFEEEARKTGADFLLQGTIYPDKHRERHGRFGHHQEPPQRRRPAQGLPVRARSTSSNRCSCCSRTRCAPWARSWAFPHDMVWRQPFPGPGLAVRVIGEITREKLDILRDCDAIYLDELRKAGLF